jgi:predicted permease
MSGRLDRELRFHIEEQVRDYMARGMTETEARRRVRLAFGGLEQIKNECREQRPLAWAADLWMDMRYGLRQLARTPLLAGSVVVMLTFGLGFNSSIFTFLNAEAFRAHVPKPESFLTADAAYTIDGETRREAGRVSLDDFEALRGAAAGLANLTASADSSPTWLDRNDSIPVMPRMVMCNYFAVYGLERPLLGRVFQPADCTGSGNPAIAVVSERIWRGHFDADPHVVGKTAYIGRQPFTIAGVVPASFAGGNGVLIPYTAQPLLGPAHKRGEPWLRVAGRLEPGHSRRELQAAMQVGAARQDRLHPGRATRIDVTNGSTLAHSDSRQRGSFSFIIGASLLVLGGVCVNVALLLLSRAGSRKREVGVRLSLGASHLRVMRMLLTESLLLAATAGVLGAWITTWLPLKLYTHISGMVPNYSMAPDWLSFVWLAGITILTAVLAGVAPGLESLKIDLASVMKGSSGLASGASPRPRIRNLLMGAQAAVSVVLLLMAAIIADSATRLSPIDERLNTLQVSLTLLPPAKASRPAAFLHDFGERLRAIPRMQSVAFADHVQQSEIEHVKLPGAPGPPLEPVTGRSVSPDYFVTIRLPILQGRAFAAHDVPAAAIVSAGLAAKLWPGQDPLGKTLIGAEGKTVEVVGVAADSAAGFFNSTGSQLYRPLAADGNSAEVLVRFEGDVRPVLRAIAGLAREFDPEMIATTFTLREYYDRNTLSLVSLQQIVTTLGVITLLVSMAGLYGVVNYSVSCRIRELGIRMAIGATRADLFRSVLVSGAKPLIPGLLVGLGLFVAASHLMASVLFPSSNALLRAPGIGVFALALGLLFLAALVALLGPARRAALCDPVRVLREE